MIDLIAGKYNYWIYITLMMIGFYAMIAKGNLIKKIVGLNIFQTAVFLFYISMAVREGSTAPILLTRAHGALTPDTVTYTNPLPHVLILTAIVVGVSVTAVALALAIRIYRTYGTLDEYRIAKMEQEAP
ncbi:MAG: cation:proton antiporter subunit C [Smithellaceae bacterium]|nr:cation:proton antiporter subunit C [Smithellaceae bacterium]